jgi:hypothetical protein
MGASPEVTVAEVPATVFALATKDGGLRAFPGAQEAQAHCKAADVRKRGWLFFSDDGSPLEARFVPPLAASNTYELHRAMSGRWLQERLAEVRKVEGGGLTTVAELVEMLKVNRGKRIAAQGKH